MKKIFLAALTMAALTASAQNDSIQVRMDFNANPWGYAVAIPVGKSYSKVDVDESPADAFYPTDQDFTVDVNGKKLILTVSPSDLDETDYDNCLFYTYDYDVAEEPRMNVLRMYTGSKMTFKAPEGYRFAKVVFNNYRNWASGGLGSFNNTWTPETPFVYDQKNDKGEVTWSSTAWTGTDTEWSTPFCTGSTMLRYIDFWLLPVGGGNDPIDDPKPMKGDVNGDGKLTIEDITELIEIYLAK